MILSSIKPNFNLLKSQILFVREVYFNIFLLYMFIENPFQSGLHAFCYMPVSILDLLLYVNMFKRQIWKVVF